MSITVFKKWTSAVSYLDEKIKNNRIIAGRNIKLENTGNGIRIHSLTAGISQSGDTYNGYFKPVQTADNKIKIVCGFNEGRLYAGKVNVNYFPRDVAVVESTITENCFIYLECGIVGSPATGATAEIKMSAVYPESIEGTYRDLISEVTFADDKITGFSRHDVNKNILIGGDCS